MIDGRWCDVTIPNSNVSRDLDGFTYMCSNQEHFKRPVQWSYLVQCYAHLNFIHVIHINTKHEL